MSTAVKYGHNDIVLELKRVMLWSSISVKFSVNDDSLPRVMGFGGGYGNDICILWLNGACVEYSVYYTVAEVETWKVILQLHQNLVKLVTMA